MGSPSPFRTRPRRSSPTGTEWISPVGMTSVAGEMPCKSPSGVNRATCFTKPTTSARSVQSSHGLRRMHSSPTFTPGTTARMMVPTTCSTRPRTSTEAVDCTASSRSAPIYSKAIGHPSVCQTISAISKAGSPNRPSARAENAGVAPKRPFSSRAVQRHTPLYNGGNVYTNESGRDRIWGRRLKRLSALSPQSVRAMKRFWNAGRFPAP